MMWSAGFSDSNVNNGCTYAQDVHNILLTGVSCDGTGVVTITSTSTTATATSTSTTTAPAGTGTPVAQWGQVSKYVREVWMQN